MERNKNLTILTYEDWMDCGEDEARKAQFILRAIDEHERSDDYKAAVAAAKAIAAAIKAIAAYFVM